MSRLGKQALNIPSGIEATYVDGVFSVKGPKGTLTRTMSDDVSISITPEGITLAPAKDTQLARALWGTYAAHIKNMIEGVSEGFKKVLQVEGVGYRGEVKGNTLVMQLGFSHPVTFDIPQGISVTSEKGTFTIAGIDKEAVGQFAANVRAKKKPEPYKGKGIRYQGEYVIRKQGKKAV